MVRTKTRIPGEMRAKRFQFDVHMVPYAIVALAIVLIGVKIALIQDNFEDAIPSDQYQAVFLTNGQVYFGHLIPMGNAYFRLEDVYYIRQDATATGAGTTDTTADTTNTNGSTDSQFSVIRLGEEIHQPDNLMIINKEDVMFWENLQTDSRVVDAIAQEKETRNKTE